MRTQAPTSAARAPLPGPDGSGCASRWLVTARTMARRGRRAASARARHRPVADADATMRLRRTSGPPRRLVWRPVGMRCLHSVADEASLPGGRGQAGPRRPRPWCQGHRPRPARRRLRGHLHRAAPDARAGRAGRGPGGRRRRRACRCSRAPTSPSCPGSSTGCAAEGLDDVLVIVGGIIPDGDIPALEGHRGGRGVHPGRPAAHHRRSGWPTRSTGGRRPPPEVELDRARRRAARPSAARRRRHDAGTSGRRRGAGAAVDLFEYQGKQYFARFGIPMSPGGVADTVDEAVAQADAAGYPVVVKAQVKVGGRGKAGGIKLADDADEVRTPRRGHPRHGHQGPRGAPPVDRARLGHRQGVLRQLHPRPGGQAPPGHGVGQGRRRDRGGGRHRPRRHRPAARRPGRRAVARRRPPALVAEAGLDAEARAAGGRAAGEALPLLRRGRLRPGRDQPADPHHRRPGPRPRRQGHPRRQRRLPPPRVGGVRRRPRTSTSASSWPRRRASTTSACRARWASSPTGPAWP